LSAVVGVGRAILCVMWWFWYLVTSCAYLWSGTEVAIASV